MSNAGSPRLLERLVADGLLGPEQQEAALSYMQRSGERVEEALLDLKFLEEVALLKYLATLHKTRFVSTEKLAKADIDRLTLDKVPKKLAERELIFPVLYDTTANVLSVVTPNPDNAPALHDIQLASNLKEVRAFVGRPRSVRAARVPAKEPATPSIGTATAHPGHSAGASGSDYGECWLHTTTKGARRWHGP